MYELAHNPETVTKGDWPLPSVFLLGAAKCGTTTLSTLLEGLPDVCFAVSKEPWFFEVEYELGLDYYRRRYFPHWRGEPLLADGRHRNLYLPWVPQRMHATNPHAKLIVIFRNPVDRAYSHWWYACNHGAETKSFEIAIRLDHERIQSGRRLDTPEEFTAYHLAMERSRRLNSNGDGIYRTYLDSGYYVEQLDRYLRLFPRENLLVLLFEDLVADQAGTIQQVAEHIGVTLPPDWPGRPVHGEAKSGLTVSWLQVLSANRSLRRAWPYVPGFVKRGLQTLRSRTASWPEMDHRTRDWLGDHFRPHVTALECFLDRDLSHWR